MDVKYTYLIYNDRLSIKRLSQDQGRWCYYDHGFPTYRSEVFDTPEEAFTAGKNLLIGFVSDQLAYIHSLSKVSVAELIQD